MSNTLTPLPLRKVVAAKRRIDAAEGRVDEARREFVEALRGAIAAGFSQADVGRATGLTRARISQILSAER